MNLKYQLAFLFCGFASCAAVETSKPIKAKTQPAPHNTTPTIMTKIVATEEVKKRHLSRA
jgi:hypothetical protein